MSELTKIPKNRTYRLLISPHGDEEVARILEVLPKITLYQLAHDITFSYGYYFDHCFGFYDVIDEKGYIPYKTGRSFELFADIDREEGLVPETCGTKLVPLTDLWKKPGDTWYFLFDYGDTRIFDVTLKEFGKIDPDIVYPSLQLKVGEAQPQYPKYDDTSEYDDEE
jgi:Plasmid pRiA4b ORF-3-like protein